MNDNNSRDDISLDIKQIEDLEMRSHEREVEWREEHEKILIEWADKAMCYRWLHTKAHSKYSNLNALYTIPVIIISTLTGAASFAQERVASDYVPLYVMILGSLNIFAGIVTTIQQFLKITQLNEGHRVSSISWDKFYRNVKLEITKHPNDRMHAGQMLKIYKEEFDRLIETSPTIPDSIISDFKISFKDNPEFECIAKPEILDYLTSTEKVRYIEKNDPLTKNLELSKRHSMVKRNLAKVQDWCNTFKQIHGRDPLSDEIVENYENSIEKKELDLLIKTIEKNRFTSLQINNVD